MLRSPAARVIESASMSAGKALPPAKGLMLPVEFSSPTGLVLFCPLGEFSPAIGHFHVLKLCFSEVERIASACLDVDYRSSPAELFDLLQTGAGVARSWSDGV